MNTLQISQFTLLPSASFLCTLDETPTTLMGSKNLWISLTDSNRYDKLTDKVQNIILALKNMNSKAAKETAGEDGDDE